MSEPQQAPEGFEEAVRARTASDQPAGQSLLGDDFTAAVQSRLASRREAREVGPDSGRGDAEVAANAWEALEAGWQRSTGGLIARHKSPEVMVQENAPAIHRILETAAMVVGDAPTLVTGGVIGAFAGTAGGPVGTAVGAGSGSMALTEGYRRWMLDRLEQGENPRSVAERATGVLWATSKGAAIGGVTAGAGARTAQFAKALVPKEKAFTGALPGVPVPTHLRPRIESVVGQQGTIATAEAASMVAVASALEGQIPKLNDFRDAALMIYGVRMGVSAGASAMRAAGARRTPEAVRMDLKMREERLKEIYRRTGVHPKQVVDDAQNDSKLWQQLLDEDFDVIPDKYKRLEVSPMAWRPSRALQDELDPQTVAQLRNPVPKERRGPEHINLDTFDLPDGPAALADEVSRLARQEMLDAQGGRRSVPQMLDEATGWLRRTLGEQSLKTALDPGSPDFAAEILGRKMLAQAALRDTWNKAEALAQAGGKATPQQLADFQLALDRTARVQKAFRGRSAEIGRAMRALKEAAEPAGQGLDEAAVMKGLKRAGGKDEVQRLAELTAQVRDPGVLARLATRKTPFQKFTYLLKAGMLSAPQTLQITTLGNIAFSLSRVPEMYLAGAIGKIPLDFLPGKKNQTRAGFIDATAHSIGMWMGSLEAMQGAAAVLRTNMGERGVVQGLLQSWREVPLSSKLDLLDQGKREIVTKAARQQAQKEGLKEGTPEFKRRTEDIINDNVLPEIFTGKAALLDDAVRLPYNIASLGDLHTRFQMNRAVIWEEAVREASARHTPGTQAWKEAVVERARNPMKQTLENANKIAERMAFRETGKATEWLHYTVRQFPILEPTVLPFRTAAAAAPREAIRRTPFAPAIESWRADFMKGGASRDQAIAELLGGSTLAVAGFMLARAGLITGSGNPDSRQRRADYNAGFQPYSVVDENGMQHQYQRWEPHGTLLGLGADVATAWSMMTEGEREKASYALVWAGREVFLNKTWLRGVSETTGALMNPQMYGQSRMESLVSPFVPNFIASHARELDPYVREVDSILSAVQARIPYLRENLPPVIDGFGQPVETGERLWPGAPIMTRQQSDDPVRLAAQEIGFSLPGMPKSLSAGSVLGESARVDITADERSAFQRHYGQMVYDQMQPLVNDPSWANYPPLARRRVFEQVASAARASALHSTLPPEKRKAAVQALAEEEGVLPGSDMLPLRQ